MTAPELPQLYHALREAARRQLDLLAAEDFEAFSEASVVRERAFEAVRARAGDLATMDEARLAEIHSTIRQILADDAKTSELAARQSAQAQEELGLVQQGMSALNAYASEAFPQSYFIDRSS